MTPKFGCNKNSYRKDDDNKISVEILRQRLIFRTERTLMRDVAGSCKRSVTSHRTMQCHIQLAIYVYICCRQNVVSHPILHPIRFRALQSITKRTCSSTVHTRLGKNDSSSGVWRHQQHLLSSANLISQLTKL